jgi:enoyl-CoA hydratase/carnithine racemase
MTEDGHDDGLIVSVEDGVVELRLDRPPKNLLAPDLMASLRDALLAADANPDIRAIVVTGTGDTFCGGLDLQRLQAGGNPVDFATHLVGLLRVFPGLGKPVIGAVNGDALAGGFALAQATDIAIAVEGARLGTFETSVGIWPMVAQVLPIHRLLPRHALHNILSGTPFDARRAYEIGAVNEVVASERLAEETARWVALATRAGGALAAGRRAFYRFRELSYDDALTEALTEFTAMMERAR